MRPQGPRMSGVLEALRLAGRVVASAGYHWKRHPLASRALLSALFHVPARIRFGDFTSSLVLTRAQVDAFFEGGWDYAEPRLQLLRQARQFPFGRAGVRAIVEMRRRMESSRDGTFGDVVSNVYRDPVYPIFQHLGQAFRNYITGRQPFVLAALAEADVQPRRVCDVGCGAGVLLGDVLHAAPHARGFGIDISPVMVSHARSVLQTWRLGDRATVLSGDLRRLPFPDGFFNFVVATEVLEHLPDPRPGIRELARVVAPDGTLVTSIPVGDPAPTHLHCFASSDEVDSLHRDAGLMIRRKVVREVAPGVPNVLIASQPSRS